MTNVLLPVRVIDDDVHTLLSPELALVDPDLAAAARMLLPDPVEPERTLPTLSVVRTAPPRAVAPPERKPAPSTRARATRTRVAAVAATGLAALAAGAFGFALAADHGSAEETPGPSDASRSALQAQAARQARAARTYTWPAVTGADAYEFEILRGKRVVFQTTTRKLAVELPVPLRLTPGRYTWSVTPTYENQSAVLVRRPVVEATFQVTSP